MVDQVGMTTNPLENSTMGTRTSTRTGSSTSGTAYDPLALAAAMQSGVKLAGAGGDIDTAMAAVAKAGLERQAGEQAQQAAIQDYAGKTAEATRAKSEAEAAQAARRRNILDTANINPDMADSLFSRASNELFTTSSQLETLGAEIDKRMSVGLFDNPLEWLVNQTRLPGMVGEYNAVASRQNRALETARNAQALANSQLAISTNMDADMIKKQADAQVAADASAAQAKLAEVQTNAAGAASRDAATMLSMSAQKFQVDLSIAKLTQERWQSNEYQSEKDAAKAAEQYQLDKVNEYMARIGSSIRYDSIGFKAVPAAKRQALIERAGTPYIATEFDDAAAILDSEGSLSRIAEEGDSAAVNWFRGTMLKSQQGIKAKQAEIVGSGGKALPDEKIRDLLLRSKKTQYVMEAGSDMRKADEHNPYRIAYDFVAMSDGTGETQGMPGIRNNIVTNYIKEYGPKSKTPAYTQLDEAVMLDKISTDVINNKIPVGAAAMQIAMFYKDANKIQAMRSKYPLFGLDENTGYIVKLPSESSFFSSAAREGATLDLTNPAAIEAYLVKDSAKKLKSKQHFEQLIALPPAM